MAEEIAEVVEEEDVVGEEEELGVEDGCCFGADGEDEVLERSAWISARNLVSSESASEAIGCVGGGGGGADCSTGFWGGLGEDEAQSQPMVMIDIYSKFLKEGGERWWESSIVF